VLARDAITVCDLFVLDQARADESTVLHGIVIGRNDAEPIAGARVSCAGRSVSTGPDGRFEVPESIRWRDLVDETRVEADGFVSFRPALRTLSMPWIERLRRGDAVFALSPTPESPARQMHPELGK
jgi:hypothetical protein